MYAFPDWRAAPAENVPAALADWLCETGSLTERLIASGRLFAVEVLAQGVEPAWPDEAAALGLTAGASALVREVRLTLDGAPFVYARSLCRADSPAWAGVLARGSRSLGLTLFADPGMLRHPLQFITGPARPAVRSATRFHPASPPERPAPRQQALRASQEKHTWGRIINQQGANRPVTARNRSARQDKTVRVSRPGQFIGAQDKCFYLTLRQPSGQVAIFALLSRL